MSDYLYAVIPYYKGITLYSPDELEEGLTAPILPELKGINSGFDDVECLKLFKEFLMINTCCRQVEFINQPDGYSWLRAETYKIAKALGAHETWYVAELATDEMDLPDFRFEDWLNSFKEGIRHAAELNVDILKDKFIWSYYHDDFSDIILERPTPFNYTEENVEEEEYDEDNHEITQFILLQNDGTIKIELKDSCWDNIFTMSAQTLKEANDNVLHWIEQKNKKDFQFIFESDGIERTLIQQYIKALDLASLKHREQKDKAGMPYFGHIARVSNACKTGPAKVVALLHDIIENTDVTEEYLEEKGIAEFVIKAVLCLTHKKGEAYDDFIHRTAKNPIAREMKIADLEDNMDVRRLENVTEEDFKRMDKYLNAWKYLKSYT